MDEIIDMYAAYRLLSLDNDPGSRAPTVEVAHEAILREWERLRGWLNDSRDEIRLQRQLASAAQEWRDSKQDASFLLRGSRLETLETWAQTTQLALTSRERDFLAASLKQREAEYTAEQERQAKEIRLEKRSQNFLRGLVAVLVVATLGAIGLTSSALNSASAADIERDNTQNALATSDANFARAEQQRLYLTADNAMDNNATGNVGMALAVRSLQYGYIPGADAALIRASRQGIVRQNLTGHQFEVNGVAYSPDGAFIATSSEGGTRIYDAVTGEQLRLLPQEGLVHSVAFSQDGTNILTAGSGGDIRLWDTATGTLIRTYLNDTETYFAVFTPDGRRLVAGLGDAYQEWDVLSGIRLETYPYTIDDSHELFGLLYGENGGLQYAIKDADNRVYFEDSQTREITCTVLDTNVGQLTMIWWSDVYRIGILATDENIAYTWNLDTCMPLVQFTGHSSRITNADYDPNQNVFVTTDSSGVAIEWSLQTGQEIARYLINGGIKVLDISPDGKSLIMLGWNVVSIWDMEFPQQPRQIATNQQGLTAFPRFSPDGVSLYIGGFGMYSRWNLSEESLVPMITYEQPIRTLDISTDGQYLFATVDSITTYSAYLINANTGETIREFAGHTQELNWVDISNDGSMAVTSSFDFTARIWDVATGAALHILTGHTGVVASASFSPDDTMVLTTSSDGTVRLWDTQTGIQLQVFEQGAPIPYGQISPDGTLLATADTDGFGHIWNIANHEEVHTLVGHTATLWTIRFSPDGTQVVTASWDGTARIWDVETGALVRVLDSGSADALYWAEFSPDGETIVTGSIEGDRVNLWQVDLEDTIASFCDRYALDLTTEQRVQYGVIDDAPTCP